MWPSITRMPPRKPDPSLPPSFFSVPPQVVNKHAFWTRVADGKERHDTLVREILGQGILTAQGQQGVMGVDCPIVRLFRYTSHAPVRAWWMWMGGVERPFWVLESL